MNLGGIVETAPTQALFAAPRHPYSRALLSAIPVPKPQAKRARMILQGEMPSALNPPSGCRFHTRCPFVVERCRNEVPELVAEGTGPASTHKAGAHQVACHRSAELPPADGVVPSDGGFSPALEKLVAAFSLSEEGPAGGGVGIVGGPTAK
jgi:peptide/nickel transport system ATP-binding protein/oligopeptide transport system ATP-binding protein